jgi:hypothetical protein
MAMPPDLPENLWKIRDEIVDNFLNGFEPPLDMKLIQEWLESDGIDNLWRSDGIQGYAINLASLAQICFFDNELNYSTDIDGEILTDEMRVKFAREIISEVIEGDNNTYGIHSVNLGKKDGKSVYLACIQESQGQSGLVYEWFGVFDNLDQLLDEVARLGYFFTGEIDTITDEEILAVWNKN